ncbi:MAG: GNAT family N-acetyltransferase [candidate division KSB1 bacterium]|nr:GNAT family N-acetyltransferase [candidate division KSB1 bacterium]
MAHIRQMSSNDLNLVNALLSRAFTQGRVDDGYMHSHVPLCQTDFLKWYYNQNPEGCFVLEHESQCRGAAFTHLWGDTGWFGPLAIAPERHLTGLGKQLLLHCIRYLKMKECKTIGLETNPRSKRNIGFYGRMGFVPSLFSVDMMCSLSMAKIPVTPPHQTIRYSRLSEKDRNEMRVRIQRLTAQIDPGASYTEFIKQTDASRTGDTLMFIFKSAPVGFCVMQNTPTTVEENRAIMRTIVFAAHPQTPEEYLRYMIKDIEMYGKEMNLYRHLIRIPFYTPRLFQLLLKMDYRVINTDMRMIVDGYPEQVKSNAIYANRWV